MLCDVGITYVGYAATSNIRCHLLHIWIEIVSRPSSPTWRRHPPRSVARSQGAASAALARRRRGRGRGGAPECTQYAGLFGSTLGVLSAGSALPPFPQAVFFQTGTRLPGGQRRRAADPKVKPRELARCLGAAMPRTQAHLHGDEEGRTRVRRIVHAARAIIIRGYTPYG